MKRFGPRYLCLLSHGWHRTCLDVTGLTIQTFYVPVCAHVYHWKGSRGSILFVATCQSVFQSLHFRAKGLSEEMLPIAGHLAIHRKLNNKTVNHTFNSHLPET